MKSIPRISILLMVTFCLSFLSCEENPFGPDPTGGNLDDLAGEWVRVLSNNPASDGMELSVVGNTGTITDKAGSGFNVGDVKWNDISPADATDFAYKELGSDYNYYDATMNLEGDTVYLSVASSGAGNVQKWVKKSKYTKPDPSDETVVVDCSITAPTVWQNGPAAIDYIIPCVLDVTSSLIIEPGTVIAVEENGGIGVYDDGSIRAQGISTEPIRFQGKQNIQGYWRGIHIETSSVNNRFDHVFISDAGSNYVYCCNDVASVYVKEGKFSMQNTEISNGGGMGLRIGKDTEIPFYQANKITTHKDYPLSMTIGVAGQLDGTDSDYSGNEKDFALLQIVHVTNPSTLKKLNVPYLSENSVYDVKEKLTVEAGVELAFAENGGLGVFDGGSLTVAGTDSNPVIFRGKERVSGYWRGVHIETNSLNNDINYLELSDAGSNYVYCCNIVASLFLKDGKTSLKNVTISQGDGYGIRTTRRFSFTNFENVRITSHQEEPLSVSIEQAGQLDGENSDFTGNSKDYVGIYNSQVLTNTTLLKNNVPYSIGSVIDVTQLLVIAPGTIMAFEANAGLGVYDNGSLNAIGTSGQKISFIGRNEAPGFWRGIHTETTNTNNILDYVEIKNAGSNYVYCCNDIAALFVKDGTMSLSNSVVADNAGCGVFVKGGATLTESGNTFVNNAEGHLCN